MTSSGQSDIEYPAARLPPEDRVVDLRVGDLECLLDRVVYSDKWTPDRLEDLDAALLEAVARGRATLEAIE